MLRIYDKFETLNKISSLINPFKTKWINNDETNCYAYALGIDLTREEIYPFPNFNPGSFSGIFLNNPFDIEDLLFCIDSDLENLGLEHKEVDFDYKLNENEWLMSIMATSQFNYGESSDFHFVKYVQHLNMFNKKGEWSHKKGFYSLPTNLDSMGKKIINPVESLIETDGLFSSTKYDHIKTYCLNKKQV